MKKLCKLLGIEGEHQQAREGGYDHCETMAEIQFIYPSLCHRIIYRLM